MGEKEVKKDHSSRLWKWLHNFEISPSEAKEERES